MKGYSRAEEIARRRNNEEIIQSLIVDRHLLTLSKTNYASSENGPNSEDQWLNFSRPRGCVADSGEKFSVKKKKRSGKRERHRKP